MICACGVYYFSAPFDRFITCDQKPDERWIRCGTDEECSLSHPLSTSLTHKLVLDVAGMSIARGRSDRNKQPFLPPKHKSRESRHLRR